MKRVKFLANMILIVLVFNFAVIKEAFAYLDLGTGSYLLQILGATIFVLLYYFKNVRTKLLYFFKGLFNKVKGLQR